MKDIKAVRGRRYITELVSQGEHVNQDFKYIINDARKIARSLSAFANHSGGRLLIGVKDNGVIAGIRNDEDIYVVEQAADMFCRPACHVEFSAFRVEPSVTVIRASVDSIQRRPVMVDEGGGVFKAYYRVADENIVAHRLMVDAWRLNADDDLNTPVYSADGDMAAVLDVVADDYRTPEEMLTMVHLSRRRLDDIITRLVAMGLLEFEYRDHAWKLTRPTP